MSPKLEYRPITRGRESFDGYGLKVKWIFVDYETILVNIVELIHS